MGRPTVREITDDSELRNVARVVRDSFRPVALELGLTRENCPTHPSFVTTGQLRELRSKSVKLFGLFLDSAQVGCVVVERADASLYYMEKLAVLPQYRHRGYGGILVEFAVNYAREGGGRIMSIGIINEHTVLKDWYQGLGFRETGTRRFAHLPFTVCFMEKAISA